MSEEPLLNQSGHSHEATSICSGRQSVRKRFKQDLKHASTATILVVLGSSLTKGCPNLLAVRLALALETSQRRPICRQGLGRLPCLSTSLSKPQSACKE